MRACASWPACETSTLVAGRDPQPLVLVDGVPVPHLAVLGFDRRGPLDERRVALQLVEPAGSRRR